MIILNLSYDITPTIFWGKKGIISDLSVLYMISISQMSSYEYEYWENSYPIPRYINIKYISLGIYCIYQLLTTAFAADAAADAADAAAIDAEFCSKCCIIGSN